MLDALTNYVKRLADDDEVDFETFHSANRTLQRIRAWQEENGTKVPDAGHDKLGDSDG